MVPMVLIFSNMATKRKSALEGVAKQHRDMGLETPGIWAAKSRPDEDIGWE